MAADMSEIKQGGAALDAKSGARRRFLVGGIIAAPAILTLTSRPALANHCTISGMQSGNLSKPHNVTCQGLTPGYWKTHPTAWPNFEPGPCNPITAGPGHGTCSDYSVPTPQQLAEAMLNNIITQQQANDYLAAPPGTLFSVVFSSGIASADTLTLMQALWLEDTSSAGGPAPLLAHAVAAVLNAYQFGSDIFGYTPAQIVEMVRNGVVSGNIATLQDNLVALNEGHW